VSSDVSREIGARCDSRDECDDICLADPDFPGGFCSVSCANHDDCPGGTQCVDIGQGVCLYECDASHTCDFLGTGWECTTEDAVPDGEVTVCAGD
jgi:hypothetical protein